MAGEVARVSPDPDAAGSKVAFAGGIYSSYAALGTLTGGLYSLARSQPHESALRLEQGSQGHEMSKAKLRTLSEERKCSHPQRATTLPEIVDPWLAVHCELLYTFKP